MANRILTAELVRALFTYDPLTGSLTRRTGKKTGMEAAYPYGNGYFRVSIFGRDYRAHRVIWLLHTGYECATEVDHINRVKSDNRWGNLRAASHSQNTQNFGLRVDSTSGARGVWQSPKTHKWHAHIRVSGKKIHLGCFDTLEYAAQARATAEKRVFTNSPLNTALLC